MQPEAQSTPGATTPADNAGTTPPAIPVPNEAVTPPNTPATNPSTSTDTPPATPTPPPGAPESYDFKSPEDLKFDATVLSEFSTFAKEKNLTQEEAQKFVDMGSKVAQQTRDAFVEQVKQTQAQWIEASRTDKEFGGDNLDKNLALANKALETFGTPQLKELLDTSGLGHHPELMRAFFRVGQAISEDRLVQGGHARAPSDPNAKMYPTMVKT